MLIPSGWTLDLVDIPVDEQWGTILDVAQTAERTGFDSAWVVDHFHTTPEPTQESTYEAWSLIAALAAATKTIRLGQMATCNSYRSPAYLAHLAASVDVISGGRLEFGIGAGWYQQEYRAHGYPFPKPSVRIGQLAETIQILQRMWTDDKASFEGEHYRIREAICRPKPLQEPHIPIWVAGGGEKRTLRVAARYATGTNFRRFTRGVCTQVSRPSGTLSGVRSGLRPDHSIDQHRARLRSDRSRGAGTIRRYRGAEAIGDRGSPNSRALHRPGPRAVRAS